MCFCCLFVLLLFFFCWNPSKNIFEHVFPLRIVDTAQLYSSVETTVAADVAFRVVQVFDREQNKRLCRQVWILVFESFGHSGMESRARSYIEVLVSDGE